MPSTAEAIRADIDAASAPGFRGRLLARGQSRAILWRKGELPDNAPEFSALLSYDLHSYAYAMLGQGLRLRELDGNSPQVQRAFEQAATALEAAIARGNPTDSDRDFHFVMTACAYHLAHLSARAYSLLAIVREESNFSLPEKALTHLILRDFARLEQEVLQFRMTGSASDASIRAMFESQWSLSAGNEVASTESEVDPTDVLLKTVDFAVSDRFLGALAIFLLALERGEPQLNQMAVAQLRELTKLCGELNLVPQWWASRIASSLIGDLWSSSFHERLPTAPTGSPAAEWASLRQMFVASLYRRRKAEIELWPSQLEAAARAADSKDDLVVSLPTSAGKTRVAELCILRCLADGMRVIFVTPLRALSAQSELVLRRTFGPLGKSVSGLYGSIGVSAFDEDAIRERHIVIATPEKLDFALRSDPSLLDDVGLLVFDEGHMIGVSEREVRYEVQIQRLLRRLDASQRRIVCLSAVLPNGDQVDDFANWLRRDQPGGLVRSDWRPTRLRYGEVVWRGDHARLNLRVGEERPFVPRFFTASVPPKGKRKKLFPSNLGELCLATAWRLLSDGQSVLIFCPVRAHVEPFASRVIDLHARGILTSVLSVDSEVIRTAITIGEEWLGTDHPILACLRLGVAIHHGALPAPYRKEVERLLQQGVLKITISSPTLAQGLNLSATVVIFHSLYRNRERIKAAEFKNVIGRAGRAFVDLEGLVLYPIYDDYDRKAAQWLGLIDDVNSLSLESGLLILVNELLVRMKRRIGTDSLEELTEYVLNNANAWSFVADPLATSAQTEKDSGEWNQYIATLDTAILSMLGDNSTDLSTLAHALDEILKSSLWSRRIKRLSDDVGQVLRAGLQARARVIWSSSSEIRRKGYFLAGVGLETGQALDAMATEGNALLVQANAAILSDDTTTAIESIKSLAVRLFAIPPFVPDVLPDEWVDVLERWLMGLPITGVGEVEETLRFIEGGLVYRLPWGLEAIRVRGQANAEIVGEWGETLADYDLSLALVALETGTLNRSAAILIQSGFGSRLVAIKVVTDTKASFSNRHELREWLYSDDIVSLSLRPDWPTPETKELWNTLWKSMDPSTTATWREQKFRAPVNWEAGFIPEVGAPLRVYESNGKHCVLSADGQLIGGLTSPLNPVRSGLLLVSIMENTSEVLLTYFGPEDLWIT